MYVHINICHNIKCIFSFRHMAHAANDLMKELQFETKVLNSSLTHHYIHSVDMIGSPWMMAMGCMHVGQVAQEGLIIP